MSEVTVTMQLSHFEPFHGKCLGLVDELKCVCNKNVFFDAAAETQQSFESDAHVRYIPTDYTKAHLL